MLYSYWVLKPAKEWTCWFLMLSLPWTSLGLMDWGLYRVQGLRVLWTVIFIGALSLLFRRASEGFDNRFVGLCEHFLQDVLELGAPCQLPISPVRFCLWLVISGVISPLIWVIYSYPTYNPTYSYLWPPSKPKPSWALNPNQAPNRKKPCKATGGRSNVLRLMQGPALHD